MLIPTEAIATAPAISSMPAISSTPAGLSAQSPPSAWESPDPTSRTPHVYPKRAGIPELEGGCHSSLGSSHSGVSCGHRNFPHASISHSMTSPDSSGDISISHSGVSCGHRNVPHASISHSMTSPDSSGLHIPPSRTLLHYNGSFPSRPTPRSERLVCAISLYGSSAHNNVTEPVYKSTH